MPTMRPIDELPEAGSVTVWRNQAMTWLRDGAGVEYTCPPWLVAVIDECWERGYREAQADMREALGFLHPESGEECEECGQGSDGKKEVASDG